jgi:UDP-N-acetylmuramoyl-tripeptide--D-alanyl-D-alanine ligase
MMSRLPLELVLAATGASIVRAGVRSAADGFEGVSHDGRALPKGALYFAIRGERLDGHDFVGQAEQSGADGVVVARGRGAAALAATIRCAVLEVDDPILALGRLARAHRRAMPVKIAALTGSVGKTSTKEMLAAIFAAAVGEAAVHKTRGNLNNHIGVPLTLLGLEPQHRLAVVELGMSSLGEIAYLEGLTRPDACVVTTVAGVHLEQLGSIENVGRAKGEIYEGQASTGAAFAIVPAASTKLLASSLSRVPVAMRRSFGRGAADVAVRDARIEGEGTRVVLETAGRTLDVRLSILGAHHAENAAAAAATALALGLDDAAIVAGLAAVRPEKHRMNLCHVQGRTLIDDCYNASPPSVRAALDALAAVGAAGARRVAILGDMLELGPSGPDEHAAIGRYAAARVQELIGVGSLSQHTVESARETLGEHAVHAADAADAARRALGVSRAGDVLLVKGSRGMKLERVIDALDSSTERTAGAG